MLSWDEFDKPEETTAAAPATTLLGRHAIICIQIDKRGVDELVGAVDFYGANRDR